MAAFFKRRTFGIVLGLTGLLTATASATEPLQPAQLDLQTGYAGSGFTLESNSKSSQVAIAIGRKYDVLSERRQSSNAFTLKFSTPITDKPDIAGQFVTDSGLPASTAIEFGFQGTSKKRIKRKITAERSQALDAIARQNCTDRALTDASKKACMAKENPIDWEKYLSSEQYAELFDNEHFDSPIYLYGLSGSVGFDDFAVKNFTDFESETVDRTPFGASAFFGVSPNSSALYLGAGVNIACNINLPIPARFAQTKSRMRCYLIT